MLPMGGSAYLEGHIPGAVYVSLDDGLSDHTISGRGPSSAAVGTRRADRWRVAGESGRTYWWWCTTTGIAPVPHERGGCGPLPGLDNVRILDGRLGRVAISQPTTSSRPGQSIQRRGT